MISIAPRTIALVALVSTATLLGVPAHPAPAETTTTTRTAPGTSTPRDPTAPGVSLVTQPAWIATRGIEVLKLHLDDATLASVRGAQVEITVHQPVTSRTDFDRAVSGQSLPSILTRLTFPFSAIAVNRKGDFLIGFGLSSSGAPRSVAVDQAGVYPVDVREVDAGSQRTPFTTWMVVVDRTNLVPDQPLRVSWIWQVVAGPLQLAEPGAGATGLAEIRAGGRLDRISRLLARAGRFPLTLGLGPETLASWISDARTQKTLGPGVNRVRHAAAREWVQLLPEPYVPIAGPTIEAEGLGEQVPSEYVAGSNAIEKATGEIPDPRTAFVDPVDDATVNRLTQMLIGRYVVRDSALAPVVEPLTPAQPFTLTTDTGTTDTGAGAPAIATDRGIEQLLESTGPPALRVQRVLAALAEIAYEAPSQPRGIVLAEPDNWSPSIATVALLLHDLANDPLVQPVTLDDLFAAVPAEQRDGVPLRRALAPATDTPTQPLLESEYNAAARALAAYQAMVSQADPSVAAGRHSLLLSLSTSNTRAQALAELRTITDNLQTLTSGITTTAKTLTLTARRAKLPLSFQNDTKRAGIKVRVHLESPKLIFPDGADIQLQLPIGHFTKSIRVEARASGTFAMTVTLESADGSLVLGPPTRVTIRSAVFSGIGIALTVGALLFLAGWWGNHFRRTRRDRRRALAP